MSISIDLRKRIISAYENRENGKKSLAKRFAVSLSTIKRIVKLKAETGDIKPRPHAGGIKHLVSDAKLQKLSELVKEKPDRTIFELRERWHAIDGSSISHATMFRALQRAKITLKKRHFEQMNAI